MNKMLLKKGIAELIGTFVLVLFGCGVAVYTNASVVATSLAFGLVIVAMAYSIGNISGCHINPAVSLAMLINKKMNLKEFAVYITSQLIGAAIGCGLLLVFFGKNCGFGANQAQIFIDFNIWIALIAEIVLTFVFIIAILGVTSKNDNKAVVGIVIGLTLTLVHLLGIGLTGTSVNPARSLLPAIFAGGIPLQQVWIFILGPCVGSFLAAVCYKFLEKKEEQSE